MRFDECMICWTAATALAQQYFPLTDGMHRDNQQVRIMAAQYEQDGEHTQ